MTNSTADDRQILRSRAAISIGNFIEAFDFAIYGYFAQLIGALFFPSEDPTVELLYSLAVFAVGFAARPLGALLFGVIGDRLGRRHVLEITIIGMGLTTSAIGLLPTFATIGVLAPLLITTLRFVQGIMLAGEWSSAALYIGETAPAARRGYHASLVTVTAGLAFAIGITVSTALSSLLSEAALAEWGWRVPFVLSLPFALAGLYIRRKLTDTEVFTAVTHARKSGTLAKVPARSWIRGFLLSLATSSLFGVSLYFLVTYSHNYLSSVIGMDRSTALLVAAGATFCYVGLHPFMGRWLDRFGRRPFMLASAFGLAVMAFPIFTMLESGVPWLAFYGLVILGALIAGNAVAGVALLTELFPAQVRARGASLGYNLGLAALAGPGPWIATGLISATGWNLAPALYLAAVGLGCGIVLARWLPETKGIPVGHDAPCVLEGFEETAQQDVARAGANR